MHEPQGKILQFCRDVEETNKLVERKARSNSLKRKQGRNTLLITRKMFGNYYAMDETFVHM